MAQVYAEFSSKFREEPLIVDSSDDYKQYVQHRDMTNGNFVLGVCLGDFQGADVFQFTNVNTQGLGLERLGRTPIYMRRRMYLMPWFKSPAIPTHLQDGEPGTIQIVHEPEVRWHPVHSYFDTY